MDRLPEAKTNFIIFISEVPFFAPWQLQRTERRKAKHVLIQLLLLLQNSKPLSTADICSCPRLFFRHLYVEKSGDDNIKIRQRGL